MDWTRVLEDTLSPNTQTIQVAQAQLEGAANENLVSEGDMVAITLNHGHLHYP